MKRLAVAICRFLGPMMPGRDDVKPPTPESGSPSKVKISPEIVPSAKPALRPTKFTAEAHGLGGAGDDEAARSAWLISQLRCARIMRAAVATGKAELAAYYAFETSMSTAEALRLLQNEKLGYGGQAAGSLREKMAPFADLTPRSYITAPDLAQSGTAQAKHNGPPGRAAADPEMEDAYRRAERDHATNPKYVHIRADENAKREFVGERRSPIMKEA